jgi:hypothetical protein
MPFTCSICGEESSRICVQCTKDACGNHLCAKCLQCSDCCECEVTLDEPEREVLSVAHAMHPKPDPDPEPEPAPPQPPPGPDPFPEEEPSPGL